MRILMLAQWYSPIIGGEEQMVRDLSAELAARGHDVAVATLRQRGLAPFEVDRGVRIHRIPSSVQRLPMLYTDPSRSAAPPFPDPEATWALRGVIERERPEIIHAHNWLINSFLPLKVWSGARLVMTLHDHSFVCPKKRLMYHDAPCSGPALAKCLECAGDHYGRAKGTVTVLGQRAMRAAEHATVDMFLPISHAVASQAGLARSSLPFEVVPNFVPDAVQPITAGDGLRPDLAPYLSQLPTDPYLLFVGALESYKGLDVLLRAYTGLADAPPLVLIGYPGPGTPTEFPPNVTVLKNWPRDAIMAAWDRSLAGIFPSVWSEPFGVVVLEAMAAGRPVIASRIGGLVDLVDDGETGLLVRSGDTEALRGAIARLLAAPELRAGMGRAGAQKLEAFRPSAVVPRVERVYRDLVASGTSRSTVPDRALA